MRTRYSFLSILFLGILPAISSSQNIQWEVSFGGNKTEEAFSIERTSDGGYILGGHAVRDSIDKDLWVLKMDSSRNKEWEKDYGGSDDEKEGRIHQTDDGGYILVGSSKSSDGDIGGTNNGYSDFWILKLDSSGTITWEKNYGGSDQDRANAVQQTNDGGYIVAGVTLSQDGDVGGTYGGSSSDQWIMKLDPSGNIIWDKTFGGSDYERANAIQQTSGGNYIVAGRSSSSDGDVNGFNKGALDLWVLKLDASANIIWEENYGGSANDWAVSVDQVSSGGYIVAGSSESSSGDVGGNNGKYDDWVLRLDASGGLVWEENFGGSEVDRAYSVFENSNGNYVVGGSSRSSDQDVKNPLPDSCSGISCNDQWTLLIEDPGNILWEKSFGGSSEDVAFDVIETSDGDLVQTGYSRSPDGHVSGHSGPSDQYDAWSLRLDLSMSSLQKQKGAEQASVHPNPFTSRIQVSIPENSSEVDLSLLDLKGRKIIEKTLQNSGKVSLNPRIEPGLYMLKLRTDKKVHSRKLIKK